MALRQVVKQQAEFWDLFQFSWDPNGVGLDQTLEKVITHCALCFEASGASLFLKSSNGDCFPLRVRSGLDNKIPKNAVVQKGEGIAGACIEFRRPLVINDPSEHPMLFGKSVKKRSDVGSAMVIPLLSGNSPIGVLNLSRPGGAMPFSQKDLQRAESVVRHIALAVENARLIAEASAATQTAKRLQTRLHEILLSLGVAIIVVDRSENITEANREALKLLGREAGGQEYAGLLKCVLNSLHTAVLGEELKTKYHDESTGRSWSVSCTPLHSGGATAAIEEVTEHERSERELARLNRLAEIGQMTAAIAHEIRNPLTSISAAARLVQDSPDQHVELGKMVEDEAHKLNQLCDQFLDFAKPLALRSDDLDLARLAQEIAERHRPEFESAGVHLDVKVDAHPALFADRVRLEQVLRNLLINALQACKKGGFVTLQVHASGFTVIDDGVGMSQDTLDRLFTPFFTSKPQGTGLGLSTVRKILDAHSGVISVESAEGKGSRFDVRFTGVHK